MLAQFRQTSCFVPEVVIKIFVVNNVNKMYCSNCLRASRKVSSLRELGDAVLNLEEFSKFLDLPLLYVSCTVW